MGDFSDSYMVIPTGASGIPASAFYCNQTDNFLKGDYYKDVFLEEDVEQGKKFEMHFQPAK
jgi:penicillin amidase